MRSNWSDLDHISKWRCACVHETTVHVHVQPVTVCVSVCCALLLRVDQRGFGVVRSDAELKELMYELYEQEEVRGSDMPSLFVSLLSLSLSCLLTRSLSRSLSLSVFLSLALSLLSLSPLFFLSLSYSHPLLNFISLALSLSLSLSLSLCFCLDPSFLRLLCVIGARMLSYLR